MKWTIWQEQKNDEKSEHLEWGGKKVTYREMTQKNTSIEQKLQKDLKEVTTQRLIDIMQYELQVIGKIQYKV